MMQFMAQKPYLSKNDLDLFVTKVLGNLKVKNDKISRIRFILLVLNNFIKKRKTTKSRERTSLLPRPHASVPYIKTGKHLLDTNCNTTSSEANLPTFPKMAFSERKYARLAWANEHLKLRKQINCRIKMWHILVFLSSHLVASNLLNKPVYQFIKSTFERWS